MSTPPLAYGLSGAKDGPWVIYLHGFLGDRRDWQRLHPRISTPHRALMIDLPGHGGSPILPDSVDPFDGTRAAILGLMDALDIQKAVLFGYSMGGRSALNFAIHHPERVQGLILESASPGLSDTAARRERVAQDHARGQALRTLGLGTFLTDWYAMPLFASLSRSPHFEGMMERRLQGNPNTLAWAINAYSPGRQADLWPRLKDLAMPSLWLGGELDRKYVDILGRGAGVAPHGACVILPGCGHTCHVEDPEAVAGHIDAFLGRV